MDMGEIIGISVTVFLAIMSLLGILLRVIRAQDLHRISSLEEAIRPLNGLPTKIENLQSHVKDLTEAHNSTEVEFRQKIEKALDQIAEIRETVAGVGAVYVSRREYLEDKKQARR